MSVHRPIAGGSGLGCGRPDQCAYIGGDVLVLLGRWGSWDRSIDMSRKVGLCTDLPAGRGVNQDDENSLGGG